MKGDFTRSSFRARKHYKSVRMQQGRVQLDADWNEQADLLLHRIETGTRDLLGVAGGTSESDGFRIVVDPDELQIDPSANPELKLEHNDFYIRPGRYYVGGILCENDEIVRLYNQPDRKIDSTTTRDIIGHRPIDKNGTADTTDTYFLVYLDVWTRHITHLDDGDLREPALGGADTASRTKAVWQVRCESLGSSYELPAPETLPVVAGRIRTTTGKLEVRITDAQLSNHLYRIEIDRSGAPGEAAFKWSRDNGAVVARVDMEGDVTGEELPLTAIDPRFKEGDWVELVTEVDELEGLPDDATLVARRAKFFRIKQIAGKRVVLDRVHGLENGESELLEPIKIRRWDVDAQDQPQDVHPLITIPVVSADPNADWLELENGIEVRFAAGDYKSGDNWSVPVRIGSEVPETRPAVAPDGVAHHIAHLAVIKRVGADGSLEIDRDLRRRYIPQGDDRGLMYAGGDGQVTRRGTILRESLAVYVTGYIGRAGVLVRFSLPPGDSGSLYNNYHADPEGVEKETILKVPTDADGIARCYWMPMDTGKNGKVAPVTVTLLDGGETESGNEIEFNAWLSNADQVHYESSADTSVSTVEGALDQLYEHAMMLSYVSGGGQAAFGETALAQPLRVKLGAGPWMGAVTPPEVRFRVKSGGGTVRVALGDGTVVEGVEVAGEAVAGEAGVYECGWTLGASGAQEVEAFVLFAADAALVARPVPFTAIVSEATAVHYENGADLSVYTVAEALDNLYANQSVLEIASGDGQMAIGGAALARPLRVRLARGQWSDLDEVPQVTFTVLSGDGQLANVQGGTLTTAPVTVAPVAGEEGVYECWWTLGVTGAQEVEATVVFTGTANLAIAPVRLQAYVREATEVHYANAADASVSTVAGALDNLYANQSVLEIASGDGQAAIGGAVLARPLRVRLARGQWSSEAAVPQVTFTVLRGDGQLANAQGGPFTTTPVTVDPVAGEEGIYECWWTLGTTGAQEVEAHVVVNGAAVGAIAPVRLQAYVREATEVHYATAADASVSTVAGALDQLYEHAVMLSYVSGGGQAAFGENALAQPLRVKLGEGPWMDEATPPEVRFRVKNGGGTLSGSVVNADASVTATAVAGEAGVYECGWTLGASGAQEVEAFVFFAADAALVAPPVPFTATVSEATAMHYANAADASVSTIAGALDNLYANQEVLEIASGDGQAAIGGAALARPLRVRLAQGQWSDQAEVPQVTFTVLSGDGQLANVQGGPLTTGPVTVDPVAGEEGVYECWWTLGVTGAQEVEASVVFTGAANLVIAPVRLQAYVREATEVHYATAADASVSTVAGALDQLYEHAVMLSYVSGGGQAAFGENALAQPLRVKLGEGPWMDEATPPEVRFRVIAGGGTLSGSVVNADASVTATAVAGEAGVYECGWTLGASGAQEVEAFVFFAADAALVAPPVPFTAMVSEATAVHYTTAADASVSTVAGALDQLYEHAVMLSYVSGGGQAAFGENALAQPLRVKLGEGPWMDAATPPEVRFRVIAGGGTLSGSVVNADASVTAAAVAGEAGVYECGWTLGASGAQEVEAFVFLAADAALVAPPVPFTAMVSEATAVHYTTAADASVSTVAGALDGLYTSTAAPVEAVEVQYANVATTETTVAGALDELYTSTAAPVEAVEVQYANAPATAATTVAGALDDLYNKAQAQSEAAGVHYKTAPDATEISVAGALDDLYGAKLPVGAIVEYASKDLADALIEPPGFLHCNGRAVSRDTYRALFDVIGEIWGTGDGTFNLPTLDTGNANLFKLIKH